MSSQSSGRRVFKEMTVTLDEQGTGVTVLHRLANRGLWDVDVSPWALTIMNGGGEVILPQEPCRSHDDYLLPARPMGSLALHRSVRSALDDREEVIRLELTPG